MLFLRPLCKPFKREKEGDRLKSTTGAAEMVTLFAYSSAAMQTHKSEQSVLCERRKGKKRKGKIKQTFSKVTEEREKERNKVDYEDKKEKSSSSYWNAVQQSHRNVPPSIQLPKFVGRRRLFSSLF